MCLKIEEIYDQNPHKAYVESWKSFRTATKGKLEARTTHMTRRKAQ